MHVLIFLRADSMIKEDFMWGTVVVARGAGLVVRNIVLLITMPRLVCAKGEQKITMMPNAAEKSLDSQKNPIVLEAIQVIVLRDGRGKGEPLLIKRILIRCLQDIRKSIDSEESSKH